MSLKDAWRDAFPTPAAERIIRYMLDTWQKVAARRLEAFSWKQSEPRLTLTFKDQLRDGAREVGLEWPAFHRHLRMGSTPEVLDGKAAIHCRLQTRGCAFDGARRQARGAARS